jgi:hypothetical protein
MAEKDWPKDQTSRGGKSSKIDLWKLETLETREDFGSKFMQSLDAYNVGPPSYKWFITPSNYGYNYHKP